MASALLLKKWRRLRPSFFFAAGADSLCGRVVGPFVIFVV
jgi:hypothetical protein